MTLDKRDAQTHQFENGKDEQEYNTSPEQDTASGESEVKQESPEAVPEEIALPAEFWADEIPNATKRERSEPDLERREAYAGAGGAGHGGEDQPQDGVEATDQISAAHRVSEPTAPSSRPADAFNLRFAVARRAGRKGMRLSRHSFLRARPECDRRRKPSGRIPPRTFGPDSALSGVGLFVGLLKKSLEGQERRLSHTGAPEALLEAVLEAVLESCENFGWRSASMGESEAFDAWTRGLMERVLSSAMERFGMSYPNFHLVDLVPEIVQSAEPMLDDRAHFKSLYTRAKNWWDNNARFAAALDDMVLECLQFIESHPWPDFERLSDGQKEQLEQRKESLRMIGALMENMKNANALSVSEEDRVPNEPIGLPELVEAVTSSPWEDRLRAIREAANSNWGKVRALQALVDGVRDKFFSFLTSEYFTIVHYVEDGQRYSQETRDDLVNHHPDHIAEIDEWFSLYDKLIARLEKPLRDHAIHPILPFRGETPDFSKMTVFAAEPDPEIEPGKVSEMFKRGYILEDARLIERKLHVIEKAQIIAAAR